MLNILLFGAAVAHDFKFCGTDYLGVTSVNLKPDPPVASNTLQVTVEGKTKTPITGARVRVTLSALTVVIATLNFDLCSELGVQCPLDANTPFSATFRYGVPAEAPSGTIIDAEVKAVNSTGTQLSCVALQAKVAGSSTNYNLLFASFMKQYNKHYESSEISPRFQVFKENVERIMEHNKLGLGWTQALNEFADMTWNEFKASRLGFQRIRPEQSSPALPVNQPLATSLDWRDKNAVTRVKDEGQCGACWAFSAVGAIEGVNEIATGKLVEFSEQYLVDCSGSTGNQGCNGGMMDNAFTYVIQRGICVEGDYPYKARTGTCQNCTRVYPIKSFVHLPRGDEKALLSAINLNPVSVTIEADQSGFQFYSSGVFEGPCGRNVNQGLLLVGYGTESSKDYWTLKHSWGTSWGEKGYVRLARGQNLCGIAEYASYPVAR